MSWDRDLDFFDRALDEYASPDPYGVDPEPEPSWGIEHVAVDAYRSAATSAGNAARLSSHSEPGGAVDPASPESPDMTGFDDSRVSESSSQRPAGRTPAGRTPTS